LWELLIGLCGDGDVSLVSIANWKNGFGSPLDCSSVRLPFDGGFGYIIVHRSALLCCILVLVIPWYLQGYRIHVCFARCVVRRPIGIVFYVPNVLVEFEV
jgi:hypothetical protein